MIDVTRLNGKIITVNCDLILFVEETPDTVLTFTNGTKLIVKEQALDIKNKIIEYRKKIYVNV